MTLPKSFTIKATFRPFRSMLKRRFRSRCLAHPKKALTGTVDGTCDIDIVQVHLNKCCIWKVFVWGQPVTVALISSLQNQADPVKFSPALDTMTYGALPGNGGVMPEME